MNNFVQKIKYDSAVDALSIYVNDGEVFKTLTINDATFLDIAKDGRLLSIEILDASDHFDKTALEKHMLVAK